MQVAASLILDYTEKAVGYSVIPSTHRVLQGPGIVSRSYKQAWQWNEKVSLDGGKLEQEVRQKILNEPRTERRIQMFVS